MWTFSVWVPDAEAVGLDLDGRSIEMTRSERRGWWEVTVPSAGPGDRYRFRVDGGPLRADPRAASLPEGPDGPAEVVDHESFPWTDASWPGLSLTGAVLYELHVGTFSAAGTFDGVIGHLGHLADLGVAAVELLPLATFAGRWGWGYDGVGLYAPHPEYGGPDGLKRLVDAAHGAGIGVIVDVVYNHLGPSGNHLAEFGPYFSSAHSTNWGDGVNLDGPKSDEVRRFFVDNALMWLADYHVDGLRLDAVHALADDSAIHFLEQLSGEVARLSERTGRRHVLVAESDRNDPRFVRLPAAGGYGLDAAWADEWHHAWHAFFSGETSGYYEDFGTLDHLVKALSQAWVYDGVWSEHRQRTHGRPPEGLAGDQFVVSTQNHDQIGNRAAGDRSGRLMSTDRLKVGAGLLLCSPFVPMLFQGEEWGASTPWQYFTDFADPELGAAVTDGRRREFSYFGWDPQTVPDPQDPSTFARSKLDWSEVDKGDHLELLQWYRTLIRLRREHPDLADPDRAHHQVYADPATQGLEIRRRRMVVAALLGPQPASLSTPGMRLLAGSVGAVSYDGARLHLVPDSLAVLVDAGEERAGRRTATPPPTGMAPGTWARHPQAE